MKKMYSLLIISVFTLGLSAQNLVLNPGFEDWDDVNTPTSWTKAENIDQEAVEFHGGTYSAKHTGDGTKDLSQTIAVTAGKNYQLSLWYKNEGGDGSDCRIWSNWKALDVVLDDDAALLKGPDNGYFTSSTDWTEYSIMITAPATATDLYLEVRTYTGAVTYWDDFSLVEVTDESAPVWADGYPKAKNVIETGFDLATMLDEVSTVYYVVLGSDATAPTVAEVMAGTGSAGATADVAGSIAAGKDEVVETVTGLTQDAAYTVYLVAADDEATPNVQDAVVTIDVTPMTPPSVLQLADFVTDLTPFTAYNVAGSTKGWYHNSGEYAEINPYGSSDAEVDWLISPEFDFTGITGAAVSFKAAFKYGTNDDTHFLKMYYSEDFDGDSASIATATWTELSFPLPEYDTWTEMDPIDVSAITGTAYFAFVYSYVDNYSRWSIDDAKILGYAPQGTDATLSDLMVDGVTVDGFEAAKAMYTVELPAGTTTIPAVTYTVSDENATAVYTAATDLAGEAGARTATVMVTAQDGETVMEYSVLFNPVIEVADLAALRAATDVKRKYSVTGEVVLTHKDGYKNKKYFEDASAAIEIFDEDGIITTVYEIGDGVTGLTGMIDEYYGMLELVPAMDPGAATSTGNTVEPQVLTVSEFVTNHEDYEAEFVKIEGVTFADAGSTFEDGTNYVVNVGDDATVFRTNFYGVLASSIPAMADIQGVAIWHYDEAKVAPRMATDIMAYSSDASLSDLMVDGTSIPAFDAATMSYNIELAASTTAVPAVTFTTTDANATAVVTDATDLAGDEAARTTTVVVTAQDGTQATYKVVFSLATSVELNSLTMISVYPVPAVDEIMIKGMNRVESFNIINIIGSVVRTVEVTGDEMRVNISDLDEGIYMIQTTNSTVKFVKK